MLDYEVFDLGDLVLESGATLRSAKLAFKTYGTLNASKDNAIVYPTAFGSNHTLNEPLIGEGMPLDPGKYFIIAPNMLGNGLSSSPSNTPPPYDRARFPGVTVYENVIYQQRLVSELFGIQRIAMVVGFSMGALQAFQWGASFPDMVERILPVCGSAKISHHNYVFLEGVKATLTADDAWKGGEYENPPTKGLRAMTRVYAGWALSQAFYREEIYLKIGYSSLEDYLRESWEGRWLGNDANDLLAMIWTWQHADISANPAYGGDFKKALGAIKARAIVMPCKTDLYFPPEDSELEVAQMPNAELRTFQSIWGHMACVPGINPEDSRFLESALQELLSS